MIRLIRLIQLFVWTKTLVSYALSFTHLCQSSNRAATTLSSTTSINEYLTRTSLNTTLQNNPPHSIHLISLSPKDDSFSLPAESFIRQCWKWKDAVLGDGRDYFIPRPRTLRAFHSLFVGMELCVGVDIIGDEYSLKRVAFALPSINEEIVLLGQCLEKQSDVSKRFVVEECVALSNCARFEVILVLSEKQPTKSICSQVNALEIAESVAQLAVGYHLWQQTQNYQTKSTSFLQRAGLFSWLDLPEAVDTNAPYNVSVEKTINQSGDIVQLSQRLGCIRGAAPISRHLSLIASGLAPRTNRPDREVIFRPYSSRDAHILLQLKRTVEVISTLETCNDSEPRYQGGKGRIKILLDGALTAGKAARNEKIVPHIRQLKEFGSDGTPPIGLANVVAEAAIKLAVNPSVETCVSRLKAVESANQISTLRHRVNDIVASLATDYDKRGLQKVAKELLHAPTMLLREGEISEMEIEEIVARIVVQLKAYTDH